jgi:hypothetical protein
MALNALYCSRLHDFLQVNEQQIPHRLAPVRNAKILEGGWWHG